MIDKETIKNNFSRYARYYDRYATVQNLCAKKLINKIKTNNFTNILDIGCGTGNYTLLLRRRFPLASIKAVDISPDMVEIAKKKLCGQTIEFIVSDAEALDLNERFDLISSNASLQWFENLEKTLYRYKKLLNQRGLIMFSMFGPLTFYELDKSLKEVFGKDREIASGDFMKKEDIQRILKNLFSKVEIREEFFKTGYTSLFKLLKTIRYTGVKGNGVMKDIWTSSRMHKIEEIYTKEFPALNGAKIVTTYQVFFCKGVK